MKQVVSDLKSKHQAVLFPSLGYIDPKDGTCRAFVHGRVFIAGKVPIGNRILLKGLKRKMKASPEQYESETFQTRIDGFLAAPGRRRRIVLQVGNQQYRLLRKTRRDGTFFGSLRLPAEIATELEECSSSLEVPMRLLRSQDAKGTIAASEGNIHFFAPQGLSVISDIDDTIKFTEATSSRKMLANTFLHPFEVIPGMADLYQEWQAAGCAFHYVSSSPWQLYEALAELCNTTGFPPGSMHLRYFRVRDQIVKKIQRVRKHSKVPIIAGILKRLPQRKFVLVGDSGEKDPEIYRFLAKRFPRQIVAILIRDIEANPMQDKRLESLKQTAESQNLIFRVFRDPAEIEDIIVQLG
ncbi:MAG: phosphatase domain-containing protein [Planctomycetota bacterium]